MSVFDSPTPAHEQQMLDELVERLEAALAERPWASFDEFLQQQPEIARQVAGHAALCGELQRQFVALQSWSQFESGLRKQSDDELPQIAGFELFEVLGEGGMGIVFRAKQHSLGRDVALKLLQGGRFSTERTRGRFLAEARTAAKLHHPNIAPIYDFGQSQGLPYLAQELLAGGSLADQLSGQSQTARRSAEVVECLARAVDYAHQNGVVHRDLKPANVLLSESGQPKIIDFGLAKALDADSGLTRTGEMPGTPSYMAPEQATGGAVGPGTDVYGLGAILYEMLTGRPPFRGANHVETLRQVVADEPPRPRQLQKEVPNDLQAICLKCLEKDAKQRYVSAGELADELRRFLIGEPVRARSPSPLERFVKWARRRPAVAALLFVSVAATVAALVGSSYYSIRVTQLFNLAEQHRREADTRKTEAESNQEKLRRHLYAADMPLAYKAYQRNNIEQLNELLGRHIPQSGQEDLRGFPWHFLNSLKHGERLTLTGHNGDVYSAVYSPDGQLLATCGQDATIRLCRAADGKLLAILTGHTKEMSWLAFAPDGAHLASTSDDGLVLLWDVAKALAANGNQIAAGEAAEQLFDFQRIGRCVAFTPDGTLLAAGGNSALIELIPLRIGPQRQTLPKNMPTLPGTVTNLHFSRDGSELFSTDGTNVRAWDAVAGVELHCVQHRAPVTTICLSHDNQLLISADMLGMVLFHDARTFAQLEGIDAGPNRIDTLALSPDDRTLAVGGKGHQLELWDVATRSRREIIRGHAQVVWSADFCPDGKTIATACGDGNVRIWDLANANPRKLTADAQPYGTIDFAPDSRVLACSKGTGEIELWDLRTNQRSGEPIYQRAPGQSGDLSAAALAFSPDGAHLASSHSDGGVRVWNLTDGRLEDTLFGARVVATGLSYSSDGQTLAVGGANRQGCALLWDLKKRQPSSANWQLYGANWVHYLKAAPRLAIGSTNLAFVRVLDADKLSQHSYLSLQTEVSSCYTISENGRLLASGGDGLNHGVHLWDMRTGGLLGTLVGHEAGITSVDFCPDQRTLASTSNDGTVRLWDLASQQELLAYELKPDKCTNCRFSNDGQFLAVTTVSPAGDGAVLVWSAGRSTAYQPSANHAAHPLATLLAAGERSTTPVAEAVETTPARLALERDWYDTLLAWIRDNPHYSSHRAFPVFEQRVVDGRVQYAIVVIPSAQHRTIAYPRLDPINSRDIRQLLRTSNNYPPLAGVGATALAELEPEDMPKRWTLLLLPEATCDRRAIAAAEIGATDDLFERCRRVHRWAKAHGYAGGFPTFNDASNTGGLEYGTVLIKPGMGEEVWIPVSASKP